MIDETTFYNPSMEEYWENSSDETMLVNKALEDQL